MTGHWPQSIEQSIRWQPFRNDSTETIPAYALLWLDGMAWTDGKLVRIAKKSTSTIEGTQSIAYLAVNGPEPVKAGKFGRCTQDWPAQVLYDSADSIAKNTLVGAKSGQWSVDRNYSNFLVIDLDPSNPINVGSYRVCWVAPTPASPFLLGKLDAEMAFEGSAAVSIWDGTSDTTINGTAYDWLLKSGQTIASGIKVAMIRHANGKLYVIGAQCP